jgi:hypothetical protein
MIFINLLKFMSTMSSTTCTDIPSRILLFDWESHLTLENLLKFRIHNIQELFQNSLVYRPLQLRSFSQIA